jgi:hypothetical protein
MRDLASMLGLQPHSLAGVERDLFGGYEPTLVLQATVSSLGDADLIDDIASFVYSAHFLLPIAVGPGSGPGIATSFAASDFHLLCCARSPSSHT